jgi:outer membrane immunogenic protein
MRIRNIGFISLMSVATICTSAAFAQESSAKFEVSGDYSYMRFNPTLTGLQSRAFNGGGGAAQFNFGKGFGIKADFQGYGSTSWTTTISAPLVTPHGIVPAAKYTTNGNMFTYLFGPVFGIHKKRFDAYVEYLLGGSASNGYANLEKAIVAGGGTITAAGEQHPFTMALGGGVDLNLSKKIALRLGEADWVLTRYTNPITSTNNQNSFRYVGGIVFKFGGE